MHWEELPEKIDSMSTDNQLLDIQPVVRIGDNPHEMLVAKCSVCGDVNPAARTHLSELGWMLAVETRIEDHDGFLLCPQCVRSNYRWEDLY
jgi:hypothetical protein